MMLDMVFSLGVRVSELRAIKHCDIDLIAELPSVFIIGKRKRKRYIPINKQLAQHIREYIKWKESMGLSLLPDSYLLESPKRPGTPYSVSGLEAMFLKAMAAAKLPRRTIHAGRHSLGVALYSKTRDLKSIQQILGHADISSSQVYLHVPWDKLSSYVNEIYK